MESTFSKDHQSPNIKEAPPKKRNKHPIHPLSLSGVQLGQDFCFSEKSSIVIDYLDKVIEIHLEQDVEKKIKFFMDDIQVILKSRILFKFSLKSKELNLRISNIEVHLENLQQVHFYVKEHSTSEWTECEDFTNGSLQRQKVIIFAFSLNKTKEEQFKLLQNECQNLKVTKYYQFLDTIGS